MSSASPSAALDAAGARPADEAGDALDLGVVEGLDDDAVVGAEDLDRRRHLADLLGRRRRPPPRPAPPAASIHSASVRLLALIPVLAAGRVRVGPRHAAEDEAQRQRPEDAEADVDRELDQDPRPLEAAPTRLTAATM